MDPELSFRRSSTSMEPGHAGGTVLDPSARWDASGVLDGGSVLRWGAAPALQLREDTLHSNADALLKIRVVAGGLDTPHASLHSSDEPGRLDCNRPGCHRC